MIIENQNALCFAVRVICRPQPNCLFDDKDLSGPIGSRSRPRKSPTEIHLTVGARPNELYRQRHSSIMTPFPFHASRYGSSSVRRDGASVGFYDLTREVIATISFGRAQPQFLVRMDSLYRHNHAAPLGNGIVVRSVDLQVGHNQLGRCVRETI